MKKNSIKILLSTFCLLVIMTSASYADGSVFEPTDTYSYVETPRPIAQTAVNTSQPVQKPAATTTTQRTTTPSTLDKNCQEAITSLDNMQLIEANNLRKFQEQSSDIEQRYISAKENYDNVKLERKNMKKNIKATEKKIKKLNKTKETIRNL